MYELILRNPAKNFIKNLNDKNRKEIMKKLKLLKQNPQIGKPLIKHLKGLWSLRYNNYRIVYRIKNMELIIEVLDIDHRGNIYDKKFPK